jgi:hypothetical protein
MLQILRLDDVMVVVATIVVVVQNDGIIPSIVQNPPCGIINAKINALDKTNRHQWTRNSGIECTEATVQDLRPLRHADGHGQSTHGSRGRRRRGHFFHR